jgi:Molecular chaperone (small heat shock protein)
MLEGRHEAARREYGLPIAFHRQCEKAGPVSPLADVIETDDGFLVLVELPGLEREDVSLEVHGNELAVFGERKPPKPLRERLFR